MLAHAAAKQTVRAIWSRPMCWSSCIGQTRRWPLILAADVLCYFGDLDDVFAAAYQRLAPGGWFVGSVEELLPDAQGAIPGNGDWALQRQGRYAHTHELCAPRGLVGRLHRAPAGSRERCATRPTRRSPAC